MSQLGRGRGCACVCGVAATAVIPGSHHFSRTLASVGAFSRPRSAPWPAPPGSLPDQRRNGARSALC